ncbi:MAG: hypothetical protein PHY40_03110 [Patescibacteria group bacterium]|jgi:hypothetical protein|nr:hypothetical protein [Patescibacteria group bacterium]
MKNIESKSQNTHESETQKLSEDFNRLQKIIKILREMGLRIVKNPITIDTLYSPTSEIGFPIVRDGANGIRASYSKIDGLKIWFTNGFEEPDDPKRQEIEKRLKKEDLI